ncbi:MAG: hypothetical protein E7Z69_01470 [Thermoplasmata archaeon]|nr:hypothetical protein [Thermoplasmata archaeon]
MSNPAIGSSPAMRTEPVDERYTSRAVTTTIMATMASMKPASPLSSRSIGTVSRWPRIKGHPCGHTPRW